MQAKQRTAEQFAAAQDHHRAGRLIEAERLYRLVCAADPQHARCCHLLGVVAHQLGRPDATQFLDRAAVINPDSAEIHNDYGVVLAGRGRAGEALARFERAVACNPDHVEARSNLAAALRDAGRLDEAAAQYAQVVTRAPNSATAHVNLAQVFRRQGKPAEAIAQFDKAISLRPDFVEAHIDLAGALLDAGRRDQAIAHCERAVALRPNSGGACNNLANVLRAAGLLDAALTQYDRALAINPRSAAVEYNRGTVLRGQGRFGEAAGAFERALSIEPRLLEAQLALCMTRLPILYADEAEIVRSRADYETALARLRDDVMKAERLEGLAEAVGAHQPFYLAYQGCNDRDLQAAYGAIVSRIMRARFPPAVLPRRDAQPDRKVRVGFVSAFFRRHSNWNVPIKGWIGQLDRTRFEIFAYHTGTDQDDETRLAAAACDQFVQGPLAVEHWRQRILADAPDILVYPEIGMDSVTARLAAQRLAPVQCASWGHPVTSGFPTIDYFLSSDLMEPADGERHYTETLVRLPNLSIYCEPSSARPVRLDRADLGLRPHAVVYWCGQSPPKYLPRFDDVFPRIARVLDDCQFTFIEFAGAGQVTDLFRRRLDRAFSSLGLRAQDHCVFLPRLDPDRFVAAIGQCDIVLDSIGWSGCNSTLESLAHNLPIVTMAGGMMRGRHTTAILDMMGLGSTVAPRLDDYVLTAVRLGLDPAARAAISGRIRDNKHRVYRDRRCIAALEEFFDRASKTAQR